MDPELLRLSGYRNLCFLLSTLYLSVFSAMLAEQPRSPAKDHGSRSPAEEEHVHWQMQVLKELSWQRRKQKENEGKVTGPLSGMCPMPRALLERGWVSSELRWEQRGLEIRGRGATGTISIICVLAGRPQDYTPIHFLF